MWRDHRSIDGGGTRSACGGPLSNNCPPSTPLASRVLRYEPLAGFSGASLSAMIAFGSWTSIRLLRGLSGEFEDSRFAAFSQRVAGSVAAVVVSS